MVLLAFVILVGTLFPILSGLVSSRQISLKSEYFTKITAPGGLVLLLLAQVVTVRLMLQMDLIIATAGSQRTFWIWEKLALVSICVNWVLPVVIWVIWVPTGFLTRALKL